MRNRTSMKLLIGSSLAVALALAVWSPVRAETAEPAEKKIQEDKMKVCCQAMKAEKQKMREDMKAQDAELTAQLSAMNSAPDDKKLGLIAAAVTHMVEQRVAMDARKAKMEEEMMEHMMQHMQMSKDSMAQCPMMKDMKGMKEMTDMKKSDEKSAGQQK